MAKGKFTVKGDRNVTISGKLAFPDPLYDEKGELADVDEFTRDRNYHSGMVVRPDGTLALKDWPPAKPAKAEDEDVKPDGSEKSEQEKAIERSEEMKGDPETRKAPILKI